MRTLALCLFPLLAACGAAPCGSPHSKCIEYTCTSPAVVGVDQPCGPGICKVCGDGLFCGSKDVGGEMICYVTQDASAAPTDLATTD